MNLTITTLALAAVPVLVVAQGVEIETATGSATVPATPETVVALDLAAIDTLTALGVTLAGLLDIAPPAYLADALASAETVGTLF